MSESIWFRPYKLAELKARGQATMVETIGIEMTEIGPNYLKGTMPVDHRTKQPVGLLHGGASVALAESLASVAANMCVDSEQFYCVGQEINANHVRSATSGFVTGVATPLHLGRQTHVWDIRITQDDKLICVSRMTAAVLKRKA